MCPTLGTGRRRLMSPAQNTNPGLTRRRFLGAAAGLGVGAALLGGRPVSASAASTVADPAAGEWPIAEPYPVLNGGLYSGRRVAQSRDPLVRYRWPAPQATDGLQVYQLRPVAVLSSEADSFENLASATGPNCDIAVTGLGSIRFDFGVESAAWLEFDSPDFSGSVELSISEYNQPAQVNPGVEYPIKTAIPQRYGNTFRLELNSDLYEGVRFGWIHVEAFDNPWHITAVRAVCQTKPTNYNGRFDCSDALLTDIWYAGAYCARVAFQQDYMGAILMDRGDRESWSGDAHIIQAAAMTAFGDWDFVKANLTVTAGNNQGIEVYSLYWVLSLIDYYWHTGDAGTLKSYVSLVQSTLDYANGVYGNPSSTFFGWDERLGAGFEAPNCPETASIYRSLLIQGCRGFADALHTIGLDSIGNDYRAIADQRIAELQAEPSWIEALGVHARAHAVNAGCVTPAEQPAVIEGEFTDRLNRLSFSPFNQYFVIQAMSTLGLCDDALVTVRDNWGGQLEYGGTTFFEIFRPDWLGFLGTNDPVPNGQNGWTSLCHPWGAGVTAWLSNQILGVRPSSPGFGTVDVFPNLGRSLSWVSGSVPTPQGNVSVDFSIDSGIGRTTIPAGASGRIGIPSDGRTVNRVHVNGQLVWDGSPHPVRGVGGATGSAGTVVLTDVSPGSYDFDVSYGPGRSSFRPGSLQYPMRFSRQDLTTSGNWGGVYGNDGYVMFDYDGATVVDPTNLPSYVQSVVPSTSGFDACLSTVWESGTGDTRALAPDATNGTPRTAACLYSMTPSASGMTFPVDVTVAPGRKFQLAMYFVDWDSTARRLAVEVFELETLKLAAPEQLVNDFHDGVWLVYECDASVRIRVAHVLGANAVLSALFFDPAHY
jgi:alpha-L-rhamnosidase